MDQHDIIFLKDIIVDKDRYVFDSINIKITEVHFH